MRRLAKRFFRPTLVLLVLVSVIGIVFAANAVNRGLSSPAANEAGSSKLNAGKQLLTPPEPNNFQPIMGSRRDMQQPVESNSDTSSQSVVNHTAITSTTNGSRTSVSINGQPVKLPKNGIVNKTITSSNGQTKVNIRVSGSNENRLDNSSSSTLDLNVSSNSSSSD